MTGSSTRQPAGLISILLNAGAECGDRDDAAQDLSAFDEPEAERALTEVVLNPQTDEALAETCAESLAEIWCRKGYLNGDVFKQLKGRARFVAASTIKARRPDWAERLK